MPCDESLLLEKDGLSLTEAQDELVFQAHSRSLERSTTAWEPISHRGLRKRKAKMEQRLPAHENW
jgi:hypothetical protein